MDTYKSSTIIETGEKVVVVGDSAVGKTSIIKRYVEDTFDQDFQTTIGFEQYNKTETVEQEPIKLAIWDTAGQERFRSLSSIFFKNARCIVFVFDLTKLESFKKFEEHHQKIVQFVPDTVPIVIMGNKSDLVSQYEVKEEDVQQLVQNYKYFYIKTSAKDNTGINEAFIQIAKLVKEQLKNQNEDEILSKETKNINREPVAQPSKIPCCQKSAN